MRILTNRDSVIGILVMCGAALYGYYGKAYLTDVPLVTSSSSLYTQTLAWSMGFCGLLCLVTGLRSGSGTKGKPIDRGQVVRLLVQIGIAVITVLAMPRIGFMLSAALSGMAVMYVMGERRPSRIVGISLGFCVVLYLMFAKVLMIQFPGIPLV